MEATGVAEPRDLGSALDIPSLREAFDLAVNVCLVDPLTYPKVMHTLRAARKQVQDADILLLNKCDLIDKALQDSLSSLVRQDNPDALVMPVTQGQIPFSTLVTATFAHNWETEQRSNPPEGIITVRYESDGIMDTQAFYDRLQGWSSYLLRAKGLVRFPDRSLFVEFAAGTVSSRPAKDIRLASTKKTAFVIIAKKLDPHDIEKSLQLCEQKAE